MTNVSDDEVRFWEEAFSERKQLGVKFCVYVLTISLLLVGRFTVPDNEPPCVVDKVQDWLLGFNYFILHNTAWRNGLQIACSVFMDLVYLTTAGYWVLHSHTSRLILTLVVFYGVRMLIQKIWYSPFPPGFWWYDPGFPSLVVPYGRGSDFFYSGHMGFLVICICEWRRHKKYLISWIYVVGAIYTCFILLAYQVHYCIDIFTGIFFAHYVFMFFDSNKDNIDGFFVKMYLKAYVYFYKGYPYQRKKIIQTGL